MLKKTIKYKDFNGDEVEEDYYFHLSKAELIELEMSHQGGLSESLKRIVAAEDGKSIIAEFKKIILMAYGKRSDDGKRFVKTQALRDEFESTEAYSTLFVELVTNVDSAVEFVNGVIPQGMADEAARVVNADLKVVEEPPEPRIITRQQFIEMGNDDAIEAKKQLASGEAQWGD